MRKNFPPWALLSLLAFVFNLQLYDTSYQDEQVDFLRVTILN